jgi:hypothetical protein
MVAAAGGTVFIRGLDEFRRELKRLDKTLGKELRQVHLRISQMVAPRVQAAAPGRAKGAISPKATQKAAQLLVTSGRGDALAVFLGMTRRSGWYAKGRYSESSGRQFRPWVGNTWEIGSGGGPYYIGPVLRSSLDDIAELAFDEIEKLAKGAFPD